MKRKYSGRAIKKYVIAGICIVGAAAGMTGGFAAQRWNNQKIEDLVEEELALAEEDLKGEEASTTIEPESKEETSSVKKTTVTKKSNTPLVSNEPVVKEEPAVPQETVVETLDMEETAETFSEQEAALTFSADSALSWPIEGNVILDYNMEEMVYFATLDQYKYNPAVLIAANVNDKVSAAADGKVIDISTSVETGQTITFDIGDGYQLIYGQLKELECAVGDTVKQGQTIGYVNEPTKYYIVEGSHLYFAMTKDGQVTDPLDFIRTE